ncbi:hypothetical protein FHW36_101414 [Chitinophaga polysaccharea]|uniref:Uncharacterized protein n=2 Tax=Chitinophaga TaxID=79328 RepID=A0A847SNG8_9BACT|nr:MULTISPECIES: hypothetical protein [Chitinophaga]NLR60023.1 hypothetical protein [Chitinophaga polysaccharea]NLR78759.1 hypothetical protein [Chitinophaga eiseniae]NLU94252.1 hypothetical protein [Chitinophaga sp. Ak27]TWF44494.1 hypothetical protein FHW36_101414 [Chitinophaga polysaccharea]
MSKESLNVLLDIHTKLSGLPVAFRERVCEECNWSTPTFYRKMRGKDKPNPNEKGKIIPALSNAEKQKIIEVMDEVYALGQEYFEKYQRSSK